MNVHNRGKFHQFHLWLSYKFSKFCVANQHPRNSPFWEFFGPLLPQYGLILPKFSPEVLPWQTKTLFENFLKDSSIYGRGADPKLALLVQLWPLFFSWRWWKYFSPFPFRGKIPLLSAIFEIFLPGNRAGSQVKGLESKFDKYFFIHMIPGQLPIKKFWFKYFPALWL